MPGRGDQEDTERRGARASRSLIRAVQDLSLARDPAAIMAIVRRNARELTGADGATFVLREGDLCHYADEDAIAPLWRGRRFPTSRCISGWVMLHRQPVAIEDVYADPRIPADAYRPTFVKSLAMVPIRTKEPIGAIGTYWAELHRAAPEELALLQALADSASVAMESVEIHAELERRIQDRTLALEAANRELRARHEALVALERQREALSALVVHDLKCPASVIMLTASSRLRAEQPPGDDRRCWSRVLSSAERIHRTALDLLDIAGSRDGRLVPKPTAIDLDAMLAEIRELFAPHAEINGQRITLQADVPPGALQADPQLLRRVLQNLVENALRHSPAHGALRLEAHASEKAVEVAVCDEGPGIPAHLRDRIFDQYVRAGGDEGRDDGCRGLGLTFCRLAIQAHGGTIWIDDNAPRGSRFCFLLPTTGRSSGEDPIAA